MFMPFIVWVILSVLVSILASKRGKNTTLHFFSSLLLSPLIGLLIVLFSENNTKMRCTNCKEKINKNANICPFCSSAVKIKNQLNKIRKIKEETYQISILKDTSIFDMNDLKKIIINNYDENITTSISIDNEKLFSMKGNKVNGTSTYIQIENKLDKFIIESFNTNLPKELEEKDFFDEANKQKINSNADKLIELSKLVKDGLLTKEEFNEQKKIILSE